MPPRKATCAQTAVPKEIHTSSVKGKRNGSERSTWSTTGGGQAGERLVVDVEGPLHVQDLEGRVLAARDL